MATRGRPRSFDISTALDSAVRVFWERGYEGAGIAELTGAMGISRPSLYSTFGDKAALFEQSLRRYVAVHMRYVDDALAQPTAVKVARSFLEGNVLAVTMAGRPPGCLSVQAAVTAGEPDVFVLLSNNRRKIRERFVLRFTQAVELGDLPADTNPRQVADFLITLSTGFAVRAADGATRQELLAHVEMAVRGLGLSTSTS